MLRLDDFVDKADPRVRVDRDPRGADGGPLDSYCLLNISLLVVDVILI